MKIRSILSAAIVGAAAISGSALAAPQGQFTDVSPTNWAYNAILQLRDRYGVAVGYPDQTFRAGRTATRAELAALVNATLDQITSYVDEKDAALASALRAEFSREIAKTNTRVTALEVAVARKSQGVGNYAGIGILLNKQGVPSDSYNENRTVGGLTIQGRYSVARALGGEISLRPNLSAVSSPTNTIGASASIFGTYDYSIARRTLADGSRVSAANLYGGAGYSIPLVNNTDANYQAAVGDRGQVVGIIGIEGRLSNSLVGWADVKLPTTNSTIEVNGRRGAYSPVFSTGLGIKFN